MVGTFGEYGYELLPLLFIFFFFLMMIPLERLFPFASRILVSTFGRRKGATEQFERILLGFDLM